MVECSCKYHSGKIKSSRSIALCCLNVRHRARGCCFHLLHKKNRANAFRSLCHALQEGRSEDAKNLILTYSFLRSDEVSETVLLMSINRGVFCIVEWLIRRGLSAQIISSAYRYASESNISAVETLLQAGADVDSKDKNGKTALHKAAERGDSRAVSVLLKFGADMTVEDDKGRNAAHCAVSSYHLDTIKILVEAGADLNCTDREGCTLIHRALKSPDKFDGVSAASVLKIVYLEIIRYLSKNTPDIVENVRRLNKSGNSCIHFAVQNLFEHDKYNLFSDVINILMEAGASINIPNRDGLSPLRLAVQRRQIKLAERLLILGADADARGPDGSTALHAAVKMREVGLIRLLLNYSTDVDAATDDGVTPLHMALYWPVQRLTSNPHLTLSQVIGTLLEGGADLFASAGYRPDPFVKIIRSFNDCDSRYVDHILSIVIIHAVQSEKIIAIDCSDIPIIRLTKIIYIRCLHEIEALKKCSFGTLSAYDLLISRNRIFLKYLSNKAVEEFLFSGSHLKHFDIFGCLIDTKYERAVKRKSLMNLGHLFFQRLSTFNKLPRLPEDCVEIILSSLSDHYLRKIKVVCIGENCSESKLNEMNNSSAPFASKFSKTLNQYFEEL